MSTKSPSPNPERFPIECYRWIDPFFDERQARMDWMLENKHIFGKGMGYEMTQKTRREHVLKWTSELAKQDWFRIRDINENPVRFLNAFSVTTVYDMDVTVRCAVHYELCGGSILNLGDKHHEQYIDQLDSMEQIGCFAMTEIGHGSNVRAIETTAIYDPETDEFVINTPSRRARKFWVGGAAYTATLAVVFAQLIVGEDNHGVHAFIVQLRDPETNQHMDGVTTMDCGAKSGWNGTDNGSIIFDNVRIPRTNLLNRYGDVDEYGVYHSEMTAGKRFSAILSALVLGRVMYVVGPTVLMAIGATITTRYAQQRLQFGDPKSSIESSIFDYTSHQEKLMPVISMTMATFFVYKYILEEFATHDVKTFKEIHPLISSIKAYSSDYATTKLLMMREMCGGHGYGAWSRLPGLITDVDIFKTAEGDNTVLRQQIAKDLLKGYQRQFKGGALSAATTFVSNYFKREWIAKNSVTANRTGRDHLLSTEFHLNAMKFRTESLTHQAAMSLQSKSKSMSLFQSWNHTLPITLRLSDAYAKQLILERFAQAVSECPHDELKQVLQILLQLFAVNDLVEDSAFFLSEQYFAPRKAKALAELKLELCYQTAPHANKVLSLFNMPDWIINSQLGCQDSDYVDNIAEYTEELHQQRLQEGQAMIARL